VKQSNGEVVFQQLEKKFGWLTRFREQLEEWDELIHIIETTESFVRKQGLYCDSFLVLWEFLTVLVHKE